MWRDAMFVADLDGEDPPDDRYAFYFEGKHLSVSELCEVLYWFSRARTLTRSDRRDIVRYLLLLGDEFDWEVAFNHAGPS